VLTFEVQQLKSLAQWWNACFVFGTDVVLYSGARNGFLRTFFPHLL